jgi:hypothetical protein
MTRPDGERNNTSYLASALLRNRSISTRSRRARCAYVVGSSQRRCALLTSAAAGDSFPRWEAFHGEVPMKASASFGHCNLVGAS